MDCIGEKIELKGWENWAGELDVRCNTTGTHSLYTMWQGYEIMFHVASFLPYSSVDPQQIERKRFIGNDIVVLIFKEGNTPFPPDVLHSHFNHVFIVVTPDYEMKKKTNKTFYRLSIACKEGVPPYPPDFPKDYLFEKGEEFREFLLVKLINAERAAIRQHPIFAKKMERTRKEILLSLYNQFCKKPKTNKLLSVK
jgi:RAP1 GTPase activating protein 1